MLPPLDVKFAGIYGCAPVQAEGTVNGHAFYFRSRGSRWMLRVAPAPGEQVHIDSAWSYSESYAPWPDAGFMEKCEVRAKIAQALARWHEQKTQSTIPAFRDPLLCL